MRPLWTDTFLGPAIERSPGPAIQDGALRPLPAPT